MLACRQQERGGRVPQVIEPDRCWQTRLFQNRPKMRAQDIPSHQRRTVSSSKDKIMVFVFRASLQSLLTLSRFVTRKGADNRGRERNASPALCGLWFGEKPSLFLVAPYQSPLNGRNALL